MRIAIIPARGGSKRIPLKNIRNFCGLPMIGHTIKLVSESRLFDRIVVSTDNPRIAEIAKSSGADVPFMRPSNLSDDYVGTMPVIAHAVDYLSEIYKNLDSICCIYATAALMSESDLKEGYDKLQEPGVNYCFSAGLFPSAILRGFKIDNRGGVELIFPENVSARSQDLPSTYYDAGQFYWGKPHAFQRQLRVFDSHSRIVVIPRWRCQDIDTEEDWAFAEYLWRFRKEK